MGWTAMYGQNDSQSAVDKHFTINCPHCSVKSNVTAVSIPSFTQLKRYRPSKLVMGYRCDACNGAIALRFSVEELDTGNYRLVLSDQCEELERHMEPFDYKHLPEGVAGDFKEALTCYSNFCHNATVAMCRRTIQSVAMDLGTTGTSRVQKQILEAKDLAEMDDDTFTALEQVMLGGHDGAHPHLPAITPQRAAVLVALMKDVLSQIYGRKARIKEAMELRKEAVEAVKK